MDFRQRVEAKYNVVDKVKEVAKHVGKRALQAAIGIGIMSSSALGLTFNQGKTTRFEQAVNKSLADVPGVHFDAKWSGTPHKWKVVMEFKADDGSRYQVKVIHVETSDGGEYEDLRSGGDKKGDKYDLVEEFGKDLARQLSNKMRGEQKQQIEKERGDAERNFAQERDSMRQEQQDMMQRLRERMGR